MRGCGLAYGLLVSRPPPFVRTHTQKHKRTSFSGLGVGGLFVVRFSSEQHFNDTDEWILQSGIIWGENFHFPRLLILAKMIAGMKVKPRDGMEGWEDSHLGG